MDFSEIQFHDEKKAVVTNILDAAVKTLDFDQKNYIKTKAKLMQIIEKPGYERLGLFEVVSITNQLIAKVTEHSGYVLVESGGSGKEKAEGILKSEAKLASNARLDFDKKERKLKGLKGKPVPGSVSRGSEINEEESKKVSLKGKERLLQLMRLLPPLIPKNDIEMYSAQIKNARLAPATGLSPPRTTGDFEKVVVSEVVEVYTFELERLIREQPKAFMESIAMFSGRTRKVDIAEKLRKQLAGTNGVAEFLSFKDLVDRHLKNYNNPKDKSLSSSLFFWRKK